jgi:DNA-binding beta-propeller fold protein YncE
VKAKPQGILVLFLVLQASCQSNATVEVPLSPSPIPPATGQPAPTAVEPVPTGTAIPSPVELVSIITGETEPLGRPIGLAVDTLGNLYVVDAEDSRVLKFDAEGSLLTSWGSRGSGDGEFNITTHGGGRIAVDDEGNVYVADSSSRVQKFDSEGRFLAVWGSPGKGDGQSGPRISLAVDGRGKVYVGDIDNHRVLVFDNNGEFLQSWGGRDSGGAELFGPVGIAVDRDGVVYVVEFLNSRVQQFDENGNSLATFFIQPVDGKLVTPGDLAVDTHGNLVVTDWSYHRVVMLNRSGDVLGAWGEPGTGDGQFQEPWTIAVAPTGELYVADSLNGRIQVFRGE